MTVSNTCTLSNGEEPSVDIPLAGGELGPAPQLAPADNVGMLDQLRLEQNAALANAGLNASTDGANDAAESRAASLSEPSSPPESPSKTLTLHGYVPAEWAGDKRPTCLFVSNPALPLSQANACAAWDEMAEAREELRELDLMEPAKTIAERETRIASRARNEALLNLRPKHSKTGKAEGVSPGLTGRELEDVLHILGLQGMLSDRKSHPWIPDAALLEEGAGRRGHRWDPVQIALAYCRVDSDEVLALKGHFRTNQKLQKWRPAFTAGLTKLGL